MERELIEDKYVKHDMIMLAVPLPQLTCAYIRGGGGVCKHILPSKSCASMYS